MSTEDRTRWDERHRTASALKPRASVLQVPRAAGPAALALDLACGQGRHTMAIQDAGYRVVAVDVSMTALRHARASAANAAANGILFVQGDTDAWPFAPSSFDLIVQVDFLDRSLFGRLRDALRPSGVLMIDTFLEQATAHAQGPSRPAFVLACGELRREFADFEILRDDEIEDDRARAVFVARKR